MVVVGVGGGGGVLMCLCVGAVRLSRVKLDLDD